MKTTLRLGMIVGLLVAVAASANESNIGVVDLRKALETVEAGKTAKAQLDKEVKSKQEELEKSKANFQKEYEAFEKKSSIMNESSKAKTQAELQKKYMDLQKSLADSQMELQKRDRDLTEPIVNELKSIVESLAKEKNLGLVLEKNESGVIYSLADRDLTSTVIEKFNQKNKGKKKKSE